MEQTGIGESGETDTKSRHRAHSQEQEEKVVRTEKQLRNWLKLVVAGGETRGGEIGEGDGIKYQLPVTKK